MKAKLILVAGKADKSVIRLKLPTVVGRARDAGLMVRHPTVSRHHCEIFEVDGALFVRDTGSLNGTLVDDQPVKEAALKPGHTLTVGPLTFRAVYELAGSPTVVAPLSPEDLRPESPTVPAAGDMTTAVETAAAAEVLNAAIAPTVAPTPPGSEAAPTLAGADEPELDFDELVQADLNAASGQSPEAGPTTDAGADGATAEPDFAPLESGGELHLSEADELTFDLEEPPASPEPVDKPVDAPVENEAASVGADETGRYAADDAPIEASGAASDAPPIDDALPLEMDDDLELSFDPEEPAAAGDSAPHEPAADAQAGPTDDGSTFDLVKPAPSPAATPAEAEFALDDGDLTFDLAETDAPVASPQSEAEFSLADADDIKLNDVPAADAVNSAQPSSLAGDAELELAFDMDSNGAKPSDAGKQPRKSSPAPSAASPNNDAEELAFDFAEPQAAENEPKKEATVPENDADLDSFLKELGL